MPLSSSRSRPARVLAAISSGAEACTVLGAAGRLVRALGAVLTVARTEPPDEEAAPGARPTPVQLSVELRDAIDRSGLAERVSAAIVLRGDPRREIVRHARQEQLDLVVVGGRCDRSAERLAPSCVAGWVLRYAHCSVLCADWRRPLGARAENVLAATDLGPSRAAVELAALLASRLDATLTMVHVAPREVYGRSRLDALRDAAEIDAELETLRRGLRNGYDLPRGPKDRIRSRRVESHDPATGILSAANDARADLIVCGAGARPDAPSQIGRTCDALLTRASCSVLIARDG
jgi:nucleotide-binding universal stress UspA family protein